MSIVNGDYIEDKNINKNKLVYDMKNDEFIHCDESCIPLKNCLEIIKKHNIKKGTINNKKVFDNFKYYPVTSILILINIIVFIITAIAFIITILLKRKNFIYIKYNKIIISLILFLMILFFCLLIFLLSFLIDNFDFQ